MNQIIRALANENRVKVLRWLRHPTAHFPKQVEGDLDYDGVCILFIADKLGVSQPTATEHMKILYAAGLVVPKRIKQWTFYKRDPAGIQRARDVWLEIIG